MRTKGFLVLILFLIAVFIFSPSLEAQNDAAQKDLDDETTAEAKNTEAVVETLNETLSENRSLRDEMLNYKTQLENVKVQNNLLMSQVRQIQAEMEKAKQESMAKLNEVARREDEVKKESDRLAADQERVNQDRIETERKAKSIAEENNRLKQLLDHSILQGEKTEYDSLLRKSDETINHAVKKIAQAKRQNERLKQELAEQYYSLGNMFFEEHKFRKALGRYKKAVKLNPSDSWAHYNMGVIYDFYLNNNKKAIYHYKKYLKLKPIQEEGREIRERVLMLELGKLVVPTMPLKQDFNKYQKELKLETSSN